MCRTIPHFLTFKSCPGQNISITPLKNTLNVVTAMYLYPLNISQSFSCFVLEDLTLISTFFALPFSLGFCNISHSLFLSYLSDNFSHSFLQTHPPPLPDVELLQDQSFGGDINKNGEYSHLNSKEVGRSWQNQVYVNSGN